MDDALNTKSGRFCGDSGFSLYGALFSSYPIFSTLIDRSSRKQLLVLVQALQAGTAVVVALCYGAGYDSMGLLAAAQLVFWTSSNLAWSANNAFTQEHFQPHEYASISGKQEVIMQATTLGSGALGVVLLEMWGMFEFACFAALASGIAMSSYLLAPYRRQLRQTHSASFSNKSKRAERCLLYAHSFTRFSCSRR